LGNKDTHGKNRNDRQGEPEAEILDAQEEPLQAMRPSARLSAEVSALQNLLPATLPWRIHPGCDESELVKD
jgi:hypothetical protein